MGFRGYGILSGVVFLGLEGRSVPFMINTGRMYKYFYLILKSHNPLNPITPQTPKITIFALIIKKI
jgi:hypothetical protein